MALRRARKSSRTRISLGRARPSKAAKTPPTIRSGLRIPTRNMAAPTMCHRKRRGNRSLDSSLRPLLSLEHHHGPIVIERSLIDLSAGVWFELDGYPVLTFHIECRTSLRNQLYVRLSVIAGNQRVVAAQRNRERRRTSGDLPLSGECIDELSIRQLPVRKAGK